MDTPLKDLSKTEDRPGEDAKLITAVQERIEQIFTKVAPNLPLNKVALSNLAICFLRIPYNWSGIECGNVQAAYELAKISRAAGRLLSYIEPCSKVRETIDSPPSEPVLSAALDAALDHVRRIEHLSNEISKTIGLRREGAWKGYVCALYILAIHVWLEDGIGINQEVRPTFGISRDGRATLIVQKLLALTGKRLTTETISQTLSTIPRDFFELNPKNIANIVVFSSSSCSIINFDNLHPKNKKGIVFSAGEIESNRKRGRPPKNKTKL